MVIKCPTHHVIIQFSDSRYPFFLFVFIFNAFANSIATDGFSVINNFLPMVVFIAYIFLYVKIFIKTVDIFYILLYT